MGPVAATGRIIAARLSQRASVPAANEADRAPQSRALVPVTPPAHSGTALDVLQRPSAPFLAQLIAASSHAPQARARRRAEPSEAVAAYRATARIV
jgi:hypothetical protein